MAIKPGSISENFTNDQKELIALYEKQIDDRLVKYYLEGKKLIVKPEPHPNYNWKEKTRRVGCDEKVVAEIIRKYTEAGWIIKWKFEERGQRDGDWVFVLKKIDEPSVFNGKSLKISFLCKDRQLCVTEHTLTVPILGGCKTKVFSQTEEGQFEYFNFCIPSNFYITDVCVIKFVRYYNEDNRWMVYFQDKPLALENLKVEII